MKNQNSDNPKLKQSLYGFQIFFITLSAIIGSGLFINNGTALELAGPSGLLLSVVIIGIVAICVAECVAELTQQFPVYNALVRYVGEFVDEEFGWVIGIAYWYMFASVFAVQNLAAADLSQYWGLDQFWQTLAFYVLAPLAIVILNFLGVFYYGIVETIGGCLKVCLVLGISLYLYIIAAQDDQGSSNGPINDGFDARPGYASNSAKAVCYAIPLVAYSFQGVELLAMTAFEARDSSALRWPSKWMSIVVFSLYLLCTLGETLNVKWTNPRLPSIYTDAANKTALALSSNQTSTNSTSMVINAAWTAGHYKIAGFLNGCLIFSVLSASNTSLYVSSRTLYGMAWQMSDSNWLRRKIKWLAIVVPGTGVPAGALLFSAVSFYWLPFLQLKRGYALEDLIEIMSVSASVACLIVWSAVCLAFIRYKWWLDSCDDRLREEEADNPHAPRYRRESDHYRSSTFLYWLQPAVAWIGLVGCILVFGFSSAPWWDEPANVTKVAIAYAAHIILFALLIVMKLINGRLFQPWGRTLDKRSFSELMKALDLLNAQKLERKPLSREDWIPWFMGSKHQRNTASGADINSADGNDRRTQVEPTGGPFPPSHDVH